MQSKLIKLLAIGAGAIAVSAMSPASAASTRDRVEVLERQVADLSSAAAAGSAATLRIGGLEQQIQSLTGRIEQLTFQLDQANARLDAVTAALSGDAGGMAGYAADGYGAIDPATGFSNPSGSGGPVQLSPNDPIADQIAASNGASASGGPQASITDDVALPINPDAAFNYASSFLLKNDYTRARKAFEMYVEAFPTHPRAADAQFRLGEIYLSTNAYAEAADAFIAHIRKHPNDPRAAEAYLKLGTAFSRMDQPTEACKVFKTMRTKYPNAAPAVTQRAGIEMDRISCK